MVSDFFFLPMFSSGGYRNLLKDLEKGDANLAKASQEAKLLKQGQKVYFGSYTVVILEFRVTRHLQENLKSWLLSAK